MATKTAKFKKKINGVVYDLNIISDGNDIVVDENGTTVAAKIDEFNERLNNLDTDKIASLEEKVRKIENSTEIIKIKNAVTEHTNNIETLNNNIEALNTTITDALNVINSKLDKISSTLGITEDSNGVPTTEEINGWLE